MNITIIWYGLAIIGAIIAWFIDVHILIGWVIGALIGFIITSSMKLWGFKKFNSYSDNYKNKSDEYYDIIDYD